MGRLFNALDLSSNDISYCPLPAAMGWDSNSYPITIGYREIGGGQRKGVVTGYTPFDTAAGTPYYNVRNGDQIVWDPTAGNDTTGAGTVGNPYKTRDKAVQVMNANGRPATLICNNNGQIKRTNGGNWTTIPTQDHCYLARGGNVITGGFDDFTWTADTVGPYNWCFRATRTAVQCVYDKTRFDRFGLFVPYRQVSSLAIMSRVPGSWFQDTTEVVVHPFDELTPSTVPTAIMVVVGTAGSGSGMVMNFGSSPVHTFFDGESAGDSWEVRGYAIKQYCSAYGSAPKIMAKRRVSVKYAGQLSTTEANGIGVDNWWGLSWNEDCFVAASGDDNINRHNTLLTKPHMALDLNCRAVDPGYRGITSVGSQNNWTNHDGVVAIDVAGEYEYSRGGNSRHALGSMSLMHGSSLRGDRGDIDIPGSSANPQEVGLAAGDTTSKIWLSEVNLLPNAGGYAIDSSGSNPILLRNMSNLKGRVKGTIGTWVS